MHFCFTTLQQPHFVFCDIHWLKGTLTYLIRTIQPNHTPHTPSTRVAQNDEAPSSVRAHLHSYIIFDAVKEEKTGDYILFVPQTLHQRRGAGRCWLLVAALCDGAGTPGEEKVSSMADDGCLLVCLYLDVTERVLAAVHLFGV